MLDNANELSLRERLAQDLMEIFGSEQKAQNAAERAKDKLKEARDNGIRAFAEKWGRLNEELPSADITWAAETSAKQLARGNKNVEKTRKSEIITMINQRQNLLPMVEALEAWRDEAKAKDPKFALNLRTMTMKGIRKLRDDPSLTVTTVVNGFRDDFEHEDSDVERALRLVEKLEKSPALKGTTPQGRVYDDRRAMTALLILKAVIENGPEEVTEEQLTAVAAQINGDVDVVEEEHHDGEHLDEVLKEFSDVEEEIPDPLAKLEEIEDLSAVDVSDLDLDLDTLVNIP